jgi:hypothetical protein
VLPQLKVDLGGGNTCQGCHGGGNPAGVYSMDLTQLDSNTAAACAQVLHRITPKDPSKSQLIQTPAGQAGGDPNHPVRDVCPAQTVGDGGVSMCTPQAFIDAVTLWINAE